MTSTMTSTVSSFAPTSTTPLPTLDQQLLSLYSPDHIPQDNKANLSEEQYKKQTIANMAKGGGGLESDSDEDGEDTNPFAKEDDAPSSKQPATLDAPDIPVDVTMPLPPNSTAEGRFHRRLLLSADASTSASTATPSSVDPSVDVKARQAQVTSDLATLAAVLPNCDYLKEDYLPLPHLLRNIPRGSTSALTQHLSSSIMNHDSLLTQSTAMLISNVSNYQSDLLNEMSTVTDIVMAVQQSQIYASNAKRLLKSHSALGGAAGTTAGTVGTTALTGVQLLSGVSRRNALLDLQSLTTQVQSLLTAEITILTEPPSGANTDYTGLHIQIQSLRDELGKSPFNKIDALAGLRRRAYTLIPTVRERCERELLAMIHTHTGQETDASSGENAPTDDHWDRGRYQQLVESRLRIDGDGLGEMLSDGFMEEADRMLIKAVKKHVQTGAAQTSGSTAHEDTIPTLLATVTGSTLPLVVATVCASITDLLHSHYLLTQTHKHFNDHVTVDPDADEWEILHSTGINELEDEAAFDDDESGSDSDAEDEVEATPEWNENPELDVAQAVEDALRKNSLPAQPKPRPAENTKKAGTSRHARMAHLKMNLLATSLRNSRPLLWSHVRSLLTSLLATASNDEPTAKGLQSMHAKVGLFMKVGDEFCRADSHQLKTKLISVTRDFFANEQENGESILRNMASRETWQTVVTNRGKGVRSLRGVGKIVDGFSRKNSEAGHINSYELSNLRFEGSVFMGYKGKGNPFKFLKKEEKKEKQEKEEESATTGTSAASKPPKAVWPGQLHSNESSEEESGDLAPPAKPSSPPIANFLSLIADQWEATPTLGTTQTNINSLARYTNSYIGIIAALPSIAPDVMGGLMKLFDVYFLSVMDFVGGIDVETKWVMTDYSFHAMSLMETMNEKMHEKLYYGMRAVKDTEDNVRWGGTGNMNLTEKQIEAELAMCLKCEYGEFKLLFEFIKRGRKRGGRGGEDGGEGEHALGVSGDGEEDISAHASPSSELIAEVVVKKITAVESLMFATAILVSQRERLPGMADYIDGLCVAAPLMKKLAGRLIAIQACDGARVVKEVEWIGAVWEEEAMQESEGGYVEKTLDRLADLWGELSKRLAKGMDEKVVEGLWENVLQGGYVSLLEGFSRIGKFSTEGRALCSMDLQAFSSGVGAKQILDRCERRKGERKQTKEPRESSSSSSNPFAEEGEEEEGEGGEQEDEDDDIVSLPPVVNPPYAKNFVSSYVNAWYFEKDDLLMWISQNREEYSIQQCISLVESGVGQRMKKRERKEVIAKIESMFVTT